MNKVFIITDKRRVCYGHGDFGDEIQLARSGPWGVNGFYPAFTTKEKAEEYLRKERCESLTITELKLVS